MEKIASTLEHVIFPPNDPVGGKHPTIIMLHGRGADENDLLGLSEYLDKRLLVISVRAPYRFPWSGGYTWYEVLDVGTPEPTMFAESYKRLLEFTDDALRQYPIDSSRLFLLGFSMGTVMSYALLLTEPARFKGVSANSGYVPEGTPLEFRWDALGGKSLFIAHGVHDPIIPVDFGRRAKQLFEKTNADLTYREYPMGHQISEESLDDIVNWLSPQLSTPDD